MRGWGLVSGSVSRQNHLAVAVCGACRSIITDEAVFCPLCGAKLPEVAPAGRIGTGVEFDLEALGRVVVGDRIGEGGMGVVYRATLRYNGGVSPSGVENHAVAVKALHPLLAGSTKARRLFIGEANALAMLAHPNIVKFYGLAEYAGQYALVMELVEGRPLDHIVLERSLSHSLGDNPQVPLGEAWRYFAQLLGALASIHALGIVHRDIKPNNILVRADGFVKLTDFGIARLPADAVSTTGGLAPGTGAYMAPEQALAHPLDGRADLYSAAIVLYEMLSGKTPFERPGRNEILLRSAQVEEVPPPICQLLGSLPPAADVLFARSLAKNANLRYQSALKLGEAVAKTFGLPALPGWEAQQLLAKNAQAISRTGKVQALPGEAQAEAEALRTAVMRGFGAEPR